MHDNTVVMYDTVIVTMFPFEVAFTLSPIGSTDITRLHLLVLVGSTTMVESPFKAAVALHWYMLLDEFCKVQFNRLVSGCISSPVVYDPIRVIASRVENIAAMGMHLE